MLDFTAAELDTIVDALDSESQNVQDVLDSGIVPAHAREAELHRVIVLSGTADDLRVNGNYAALTWGQLDEIEAALTYFRDNAEELGMDDEMAEYQAALDRVESMQASV